MTSSIPVLVTGHILHCDVIINQIESIQVVTTVRQLFTDDPPLQLSVRAFDSEGAVHFITHISLGRCFAKWIFLE